MESSPYCSILTPKAPSGIGVIRLAGPGAARILARTFKRPKGEGLPPADRAAYGLIWNGDDPIDEVLVIPASPPPIESFEICCHSGAAVGRALVDLFVSLGARRVPWSRLIEEGTLEYDLVRALLSAEGPAQALQLAELLGGSLRDRFDTLIVALEDRAGVDGAALLDDLAALRDTFSIGRFLSTPPLVVITGPPNAGKSTLFNAIVGENRALTSCFAGTTRDPVETVFILNGYPVRLVDTAGRAPSEEDPLTLEGAKVAASLAAGADLELRLAPWDRLDDIRDGAGDFRVGAGDFRDAAGDRVLRVVNKCDLAPELEQLPQSRISPPAVSALLGHGIGMLLDIVSTRLGFDALVDCDGPLLVTRMQCGFVQDAIDILTNAKSPHRLIDALRKYVSASVRTQPDL